ncbi:ATP-dependent helicase [Tissierella praeacuta]|uniref:ATP-dependent helicase n=1 Tax=Tissierella praeacuta TaxID=43131 RepID=UPI003342C5E2
MYTKNLSILTENKIREQQVFEKIIQCIDRKKSMVFDAGAGAGKTYALVQSLKYIISQYGKDLKFHNQKVLCITYTNVAVSEVKERIGNSSLILVSTIHECVWDIIEPYQKQLVEIHYDKLQDELYTMEESLESEKWAEKYRDLSKEEKNAFLEMMIEKKEDYYKYRNERAAIFRSSLPDISKDYSKLMSNVENFKKIVNKLFTIIRYKETINKIEANESKFNKVKYDARFNNDRLESMRISHDTLLEYTEKLVQKSDLLKQIICNRCPFVLVDEYQDTNPKVINILRLLEEYSKVIQHDFFVGYYGDVKQNIYDTGVGSNFYDIHKGLNRIQKTFNRRSATEIINVANHIRNDDLKQETIYDNFSKGSVFFYNIKISSQEFIDAHIKKWNITEKNKLHCFELTNELVAQKSGFENIYNFFSNSAWYKRGTNYKLLRDHVLSLDIKKLGIVQNLLFRILDFRSKILQDKTMILDVILDEVIRDINILELRNLIEKLRKITGETLGDYIKSMFSEYNRGDDKYDKCLEYIMSEGIKSYSDIENFILNQLYFFGEEEQSDNYIQVSKDAVSDFLRGSMTEFDLWYSFIMDKSEGNIIYHTYHGTKGLEFDNVIIFMQSKFGRDNDYFSRLLRVLSMKNEVEEKNTKIEEARNLFYVAVTRSVLNLSVVYSDDITDFKEQIENVFGDIKYEI